MKISRSRDIGRGAKREEDMRHVCVSFVESRVVIGCAFLSSEVTCSIIALMSRRALKWTWRAKILPGGHVLDGVILYTS